MQLERQCIEVFIATLNKRERAVLRIFGELGTLNRQEVANQLDRQFRENTTYHQLTKTLWKLENILFLKSRSEGRKTIIEITEDGQYAYQHYILKM